jgi:hypothetical protein
MNLFPKNRKVSIFYSMAILLIRFLNSSGWDHNCQLGDSSRKVLLTKYLEEPPDFLLGPLPLKLFEVALSCFTNQAYYFCSRNS